MYRYLQYRLQLFSKIFEEHNALDHEIIRLEKDPVTSNVEDIDLLKRKKLKLKDELYVMLKQAETSTE
nr:DUF465 domain-containing protein [Acinetobacter portensis]